MEPSARPGKRRYSERSYTIGRRTENKHTYINGRLDGAGGRNYYRQRTYHSQLARLAVEDGGCSRVAPRLRFVPRPR